MALTLPSMPFNVPSQLAPKDANLAFGTSATFQTLTATGYFGAPTQLDVGVGRFMGNWAIYFTARKQSATDETYSLFLLGSNDVSWANGNVEILAMQQFGAVRTIATIIGSSPTMPTVGPAGELNVFPFENVKSRITYRYLRAYVVIAGTSPTMTVDTWVTDNPTAS